MGFIKDMELANNMAELIVNRLATLAEMPTFEVGGVPTKIASKVLGKSEVYVRTGIEEGWLPIGVVIPSTSSMKSNVSNVYISPKLLWEFTGYVYRG